MKWFLCLLVFLSSCDPPSMELSPPPDKSSLLANVATWQAFTTLKEKRDLYPCGTGWGGGKNEIRMLALGFDYYKELDMDQAREILLFSANTFLNIINSNKEILPFLKNCPFQPENIQIRIFLSKSNGEEFESGKLAVVSLTDGVLEYKTTDPTKGLRLVYKESYGNAMIKLEMAKQLQQSQSTYPWKRFIRPQ